MKVKIDAKKINSTEKGENINNADIEIHEIKEQLIQQLAYGNNSCFLISGYRGTGKTTLVKNIEEELKGSNYVFVHLNISKYENYSLVLRKLIREIHLTLSSTEMYKQINNKELIETIELLYDHTFYEIFQSSNIKNLNELSMNLEGNFSLKNIIKSITPLVLVILTSLNVSFDIFTKALESWDVVLLVLSICWFVIDGIKLKFKKQKINSSLEELNRKSLYDDEIAEYHLKNILGKLKKENIKVIFVFDELDKIENEIDMNNIISDLKPLLLSDLASFIVISGQKLYYKFINSSVLDDSIMTSIFSKNIHVPLTMNISLEKLFNFYMNDSIDINNQIIKNYRDSIILNSYRTLRRFNNLILQDIEWENNESYLYIDESDATSYKTDSEILEVLTRIIEINIESSDYDSGVKDFLTYQLFIWVKKMKLKGNTYFSNDEVYSFEEDYSEQYPIWTKFQLNEMCNELINRLLDQKLLEKKVSSEEEHFYRWTVEADIKTEGIVNDQSQDKIKFLESIIEIERYSRDVLIDLGKGDQAVNKKSLIKLLEELVEIDVIRNSWLNDKNKNLFELSNKIKHGVNLTVEETDNLRKNISQPRILIPELFEGYCFNVINEYLTDFDYRVSNNTNQLKVPVDIIAEHSEVEDIIFEVKYRNFSSNNDINMGYKLIKYLKEYNDHTKKNNKLVLFWFSKDSRKAFEKFSNTINKVIENEYPELKNDIFIFYASEYRSNFNTSRMKTFLDKVIPYSLLSNKNSSTLSDGIDN